MLNLDQDFLNSCLKEVESKVGITPKKANAHRNLSRQKYSFSPLPSSEQLLIWDFIWNTSSDEWVRAQAFFFCESKIKNNVFLIDNWEIIRYWQKRVNTWGDCDRYQKYLQKYWN